MKIIIDNMMLWSNTTEEELMKKKEIKTDFGQTLYWDYYLYVKENPITNWNKKHTSYMEAKTICKMKK